MNDSVITVDVRDDVARGATPCERILSALAALKPGQDLRLIVPFEPVPLFAKLGERGYGHSAKALPGGDWEVLFSRRIAPPDPAALRAGGPAQATSACGCHPA